MASRVLGRGKEFIASSLATVVTFGSNIQTFQSPRHSIQFKPNYGVMFWILVACFKIM
jgi:hypothetical protein